MGKWLSDLKMNEEDYVSKFQKAGYSTHEDVENLKEITEKELEDDIGVKKPGIIIVHVQNICLFNLSLACRS